MRFEKILVTGGSGRLGRFIAEELKDRARVTTFDVAPGTPAFPHITGDICDLAGLMKTFKGFDAIVHVGAIDGHKEVPPEDYIRVNAFGTWNVLHAAFENGVKKVIASSSSAVCGLNIAEKEMPPHYLPMDEAHPQRPRYSYGLSKYMDEITAESFARRGTMEVVTIRPSYVLFPELVAHTAKRVSAPDRGLYRLTGAEAEKVPEAFRERLGIVRAYVEPGDLARLYRLALEAKLKTHEIFQGVAADTYEPEPTLSFFKGIYGTVPPVRKPEVYEKNPHASTFDCTKAREMLGWEPTSDWVKLSGLKRR
ncbi:MAG: NAD(P)-dependent oxidoreductase [Rhodospirillales bacterium]|nr:NAD(P)-dependent oxidoreductase [Rhodospirillales bacterium]